MKSRIVEQRQPFPGVRRATLRVLRPLASSLALVVLVGCHSDGVHTEDPPPAGPIITGTGLPPSTSTSTTATSTPTSRSSPPASYGDAKPAVDAYLAMLKAGNAAFRDPKHANTAAIDKYADGEIRYVYKQSLEQARRQGIAYRGLPATPRVRVVSAATGTSLPKVVLRDCGLRSADDVWTAYSLATGKAVPSAKHKVLPPYANTITVFKTKDIWRVFTVKTDGTRTCHP